MSVSISLEEITPFGAPAVYEEPGDPQFHLSFVVRVLEPIPGATEDTANGGYLVGYSPVCTHMGCLLVRGTDDHNINYESDGNGAEHLNCGPCPCHGTTFDLLRNGLVVLGPATQNLAQLRLEIDGDHVVAHEWIKNDQQQQDPREEIWPL